MILSSSKVMIIYIMRNYTDVKYSAFLNKTHIIKVQPKNQLCLNFFTSLSYFYSESRLQTTIHTSKG